VLKKSTDPTKNPPKPTKTSSS